MERTVQILLALIVVLLLVIVLRPWIPGIPYPGRYQMIIADEKAFLLDTGTSRVWQTSALAPKPSSWQEVE